MKLVVLIIISFVFGLTAMSIIQGKLIKTVNQISLETNLDTTIKYLDLIEQNKIEPLRRLLKSGVDCGANVYKQFLEQQGWEKSAYSKKILEKAKPYIGTVKGCSKGLNESV